VVEGWIIDPVVLDKGEEMADIKRPGVITFIGVILVLQAVLGGVAGIVLIALQSNASVLDATNATKSELLTAGIVALIVAAIQLLVGLGILGGSRVARGIVAFVQLINVAAAAWVMFTHHTGAFLWQGVVTIGIAVFVLWALFNDRADEYYEAA
jgi:hypothetical protein